MLRCVGSGVLLMRTRESELDDDTNFNPGTGCGPGATLALNKSALSCTEEAVTPRRHIFGKHRDRERWPTDAPLDGDRLALRQFSAPPAPSAHARSSSLVDTWCFLSVDKASIPCQKIGSHYGRFERRPEQA